MGVFLVPFSIFSSISSAMAADKVFAVECKTKTMPAKEYQIKDFNRKTESGYKLKPGTDFVWLSTNTNAYILNGQLVAGFQYSDKGEEQIDFVMGSSPSGPITVKTQNAQTTCELKSSK